MHLNSRTIDLLANDVGYSSGREVIADQAIKIINDHLVSGTGVLGEFKHIEEYSHNIILEIILHYGIIIGSLIIIYLFRTILKALLKSRDRERLLIIIFISYGLVALFFSGTYLSWDGFFILLGIAFSILHKNSKKQTSNP